MSSRPRYPDDGHAILEYEAECLRVLRESLVTEGQHVRERGRIVTEVGLVGWALETKVVLAVEEGGTTNRWDWNVWEGYIPSDREWPGPRDARTLASIILTHLEER